jgi:hypothetical protein
MSRYGLSIQEVASLSETATMVTYRRKKKERFTQMSSTGSSWMIHTPKLRVEIADREFEEPAFEDSIWCPSPGKWKRND